MIFGVPERVIYMSLQRALNVLLYTLENARLARVTWPSIRRQRFLAQLVAARHPLMLGMFAFADGMNLPIFNPGDLDTQNAFYNGWLHGVFASNLLVFAADGCIINFVVNSFRCLRLSLNTCHVQ